MELVLCLQWLPFTGNGQGNTFLRVEEHVPFLFPLDKLIQVLLDCLLVAWSLNCLQHIRKRRNFDAKVTCHQPICLLLHAILSGVGVSASGSAFSLTCMHCNCLN